MRSSRGIRECALAAALLLGASGGGMTEAQAMKGGKEERATLGGGCFWCVEAVFEGIPGVKEVISGYAGGHTTNPSYEEVCGGRTGHAEVIQIVYDPAVVSYKELLELFWRAHDPTTPNRQGADVGEQYRSIILYSSEKERKEAEESRSALAASGRYSSPVVTEIVPLEKFYRAEEYHQDYFRKNPQAPYCALVISPKLKKLRHP